MNVYYRGFFEIDGFAPDGEKFNIDSQDGQGGDEVNLGKVKMRPYYPVFHGVVVSVSYSFSGGFYSASLSCNSLLHFWANQKINTNGAYLAAGPAETRGGMRLDGHVYTDMTPHQIIFDLFRDSGGSMDGLEWVFSSSGNQKAKSALGGSQYSQTLRYWENRFAAGLYGLRMYGASGAMFSQMQTAFFGDPDAKIFMSRKSFQFYFQFLAANNNNPVLAAEVAKSYLGYEIYCPAGFPDDTLLISRVDNLYFGTNVLTDHTEARFLDLRGTTGDDLTRILMLFDGGTQVVDHDSYGVLRRSS